MKTILGLLILLATIASRAAVPALSDFNTNQFATNGSKVAIKSGAALTNTVFTGSLTLNGAAFTNAGGTSFSAVPPLLLSGTNLSNTFATYGTVSSVRSLFTLPTRLVFDGDSLTASNASWRPYFTNLLAYPPSLVSNVAVSGQVVPDLLSRYTNYVQPNKPDAVTNAILFAWAGINDIYYNTNAQSIIADNISNYWAKAKADGFTLVAFTISSRSDFPNSTNDLERAWLNNWIRTQSTWDYLIDIDAMFPNWSTNTHFQEGVNYIHFNTNAARMISDLALSTILGPGKALKTTPNDTLTKYQGTTYFDTGAQATPSIAFAVDKTTGLSRAATGFIGMSIAGTGNLIWRDTLQRMNSGLFLAWSSGSGWTTSEDTMLGRNTAGVVQVSTGTSSTAGGLLAAKVISTKTTAYPVVSMDSRKIFTNNGAGGEVVFTLPTWAAGLEYTFDVETAQNLVVAAPGTDTIRVAATVGGAASRMTNATIGSVITLGATISGKWVALCSPTGTWTPF